MIPLLNCKKNVRKGRAFEQKSFKKFKATYTDAQEQITIKAANGIRTRVDAIGLDANGNVIIQEFKSSQTAPLTKNQRLAFSSIYEDGGVVVGKGKGIFTSGYIIPSDANIQIKRP